MTQCPTCTQTTGGGVGDFNNMCCRLRFLRRQPNNEARMGWLKRWQTQGYAAQETLTEFKNG